MESHPLSPPTTKAHKKQQLKQNKQTNTQKTHVFGFDLEAPPKSEGTKALGSP